MNIRVPGVLLSVAGSIACPAPVEPSTTNTETSTGTGDDAPSLGSTTDGGSGGRESSDGGSGDGSSGGDTGSGSTDGGSNGSSSDGSSSDDASEPVCGNGIIEDAEQCDDGNLEPGDGCSSRCTDEFKRVFITSEVYGSNLGGLDGADDLCQQRADAAGLRGEFRAWLSDSVESPLTRFTPSAVPYVRIDGVQVASDWADLTDGEIDAVIGVDEFGGAAPVADTNCGEMRPTVWCNTTISGGPNNPANTCGDWTGAPGGSSWGMADLTNEGWTEGCTGSGCQVMSALYCFEQ